MYKRITQSLMLIVTIAIGTNLNYVFADEAIVIESPYSLEIGEATCYGSNLANITADAMQWYSTKNDIYNKSNFSLVSEKVFVDSIPAGTLTEDDIRAAFRSDAVMVEIKTAGGQLYRAIDSSVQNAPEADEKFVTPGNLTYIINPSQPGIPEGKRYDEDTSRLLSVIMGTRSDIGWIDNYRVVSDQYFVENYPNLTESGIIEVSKEEGVPIADVVIAYIREELNGTVSENYSNPLGDQRIRLITAADISFNEETEIYTYELKVDELNDKYDYLMAVPEALLTRKLQGIIGNSFYQQSFLANFDGQEEIVRCDDTLHTVIIPVTNKSGTFSLSYGRAPGDKSNTLSVVFTGSLMLLLFAVIFILSRQNMAVLIKKHRHK